jgi:hypothetical protein
VANNLLTPKVYANVMLKLLKNNLVMGQLVTTRFKNEFKKVGQTIYVKRPPQFVTREGQVAQVQDVDVGEVAVHLDKQRGIDIEFSSIEQTLTVDQLLEDEIMNSQAAQLAQTVDSDLMLATLEFPSWVGTPGQTIDSPADYFLGPQRMDELAMPGNSRNGVLSPADYWKLAAFFTGFAFNNSDINRTALSRAQIPLLGNVQPYMTQSVINLVTGTRTNGTINGANQDVTYLEVKDNDYAQTLSITGLGAAATVNKGEIFTIAGVFAVNPRTKAKLAFLQQFVVLEDAVATGGGAIAALKIANPIIVGGAYATVDSAPANGAVVTWMGAASTAYPNNVTFNKSSIALAYAKLVAPASGKFSYATDPESGISIRYWQTSDGTNDTHLHRWDLIYGVTNIDRRLGTRQSGVA